MVLSAPAFAATLGQRCCVDRSVALGARCVGDERGGAWALNATRDWADLGTLHPRLKRPLGRRLAQGLHALAYNGSMIAAGPVFGGCAVARAPLLAPNALYFQAFEMQLAHQSIRGIARMTDSRNTLL